MSQPPSHSNERNKILIKMNAKLIFTNEDMYYLISFKFLGKTIIQLNYTSIFY